MGMENFDAVLFPPLLKICIQSFKKSLSLAQCVVSIYMFEEGEIPRKFPVFCGLLR